MAAHFTGKEVNLAVVEVVRASRKVVCSVVKAKENDDLRQLEVGSLVTGTVRRIEPFGVFVGINGTRVSGLLHISNVSRSHIETVQARPLPLHRAGLRWDVPGRTQDCGCSERPQTRACSPQERT